MWQGCVHTLVCVCVSCQVKRGDPESEAKLFSVPDFIGFACREVGKEFTLPPTRVYSSPFILMCASCVLLHP